MGSTFCSSFEVKINITENNTNISEISRGIERIVYKN